MDGRDQGPVAKPHSRVWPRNRVYPAILRVWDSLNRSVRSSVSVAVKVESSVALLVTYTGIGLVITYGLKSL